MSISKSLKYTALFAFIIVMNTTMYSQNDECGFQHTTENQRYYDSIKEDVKVLEQQFMEQQLAYRGSTAISAVPIKAHIVRRTNGTDGLTAIELNSAISVMNDIYVSAGIEFFLCDGINYIDDDAFFDYETNEEGALTSPNNLANTINIYFTNSVVSSNSGGGLCGYAYFPGGPETILMANSCATNGSTLSHEVGHFFALSHTHGNSNVVGSTTELVDGSNCDSTGDNICDTPADPQLGSSNVSFSCDYTGFAQDANNQQYQPDPENLMSYSRKQCRSIFSPQQYARINAIYQVSRSNMACPSFSVDFVADETQSCGNNLTVNFTDNSVGATAWSWDVDGDDIIDYTTQNITHTYNSSGEYDVALTVLQVQQLQGDARLAQLGIEVLRIGKRDAQGARDRTVDHGLQVGLAQRLGARPIQPGRRGASHHLAHLADADVQALGDLAVAPVAHPLQVKNLSDLSHGQSLRCHPRLLMLMGRE